MHGVSSTYQGLIFGTAFASLAASACASAGMMGADRFAAVAESSSCTNPIIMKHATPDAGQDIPAQERVARILGMGYKIAELKTANVHQAKTLSKSASSSADKWGYFVMM